MRGVGEEMSWGGAELGGFFLFVCFLVGLGFELSVALAKQVLTEPYLYSILFWLFWRWGGGSPEIFAQAGLEP
jgi:hypothetical protein